jgi:DUF1680 family protein
VVRARKIPGFVLAGFLAFGAAFAEPIEPVPIGRVEVDDSFWASRLDRNRTVTVPHIFLENERTGRVANFERAAGRRSGGYEGRRFNDTDVYKAIEAASESLISHPDPALERRLERLIAVVAAAQEPDGYLFPARTIDPIHPAPGVGPRRWMWLNGSHELYNAGHLYESAVAHFSATGSRTLLDVAVRNADLVCRTFSASGLRAAPGHEEIELALIELAAATGSPGYLEEARFFVEQRGRPHDTLPYPPGPFEMYNDAPYRQDDVPAAEQRRAQGHAVRAMYLYSAMSDLERLSGDGRYAEALSSLWDDVVSRHLYLTGAVGARATIEGFGDPFELPNDTAYGETCAAVGNILWNHREFQRTGQSRAFDVAERVLYNGLLSGVSITGDRFFYENPLESAGDRERSEYFEVACCPANLARLLARLPGLVYARSAESVFVNLFVGSRARIPVAGEEIALRQRTRYPWEGEVRLEISPPRPVKFAVRIRIPAWAASGTTPGGLYAFRPASGRAAVRLRVNGRAVPLREDKGYAVIAREWRAGDRMELDLPMPVLRVHADSRVAADRGRVALQRGPLVYCLEGAGNGGHVLDLTLPAGSRVAARYEPALLGGVEVLRGIALQRGRRERFTAIPYFAWANRGKSEMTVWMKEGGAPARGRQAAGRTTRR